MVRESGVRGLYSGWGGYLALWGSFSPLMFVMYEQGLTMIYRGNSRGSGGDGGPVVPSLAASFGVGSVSGFVAAVATSPLDIVKTRMQTQTPGSLTRYESVLHGLREIYETEGARALFRGTTARALNQGLSMGIMLGCYGVLRAHCAQKLGWAPAPAAPDANGNSWRRHAAVSASAGGPPSPQAPAARAREHEVSGRRAHGNPHGYDEGMWPGIAQLSAPGTAAHAPPPPAKKTADPGWIQPLTRWD